ncbi:hydantoinase/oxoprolinase family protein [Nocardia sp. alder85J]|uniref:hydantoinase/oxoprolinase family protein n=1 Tax=Nocardia sp. alder85J TaxID=2862949 RepID=UPI001CD215CA|nr:hydantoinase/oxoprolinase family protein [Nocardia sp. alder85J]MCX4092106.1 hydantoinase/oxoprolinase family protein [Nocardia sp. alder85J]
MTSRPIADPSIAARAGIDVGGTFTDFVLVLPDRVLHHKEPSTPGDPTVAVARGLAAIAARAGIAPGEFGAIAHGTTIGLNTIIQRRGARLALAVTEGYRDILEIGRSRMPSSFDLHAAKEEPLVPREAVVELPARLRPDGTAARIPSDAELAAAAAGIDADAVAVVVLHAHTDPGFEAGVAARLAELLPGTEVAASATVWPEVREYERTLVTCMNAYIQPLMHAYFARLEQRLAELGITAPVTITGSNGGALSVRAAGDRPLETVLSGPASGVTAAAALAAEAGIARLVTFDMGGTSSDISVAVAGVPEITTSTTIGGLPLVLPVVAVDAIGAGGGSVVRVDDQGLLKVGPDSAGADPGPAAYGRGGTRPTVTDCYLRTGLLSPTGFLGGRMTLDAAAADRVLTEVGAGLGLDGLATAAAALRIATAGMAVELRKVLVQRGFDPAEFTLVPFGGAGPTHAAALAEEVGITEIVVPPAAATFCAQGAATADLRRDFARSLRRPLDEAGIARLREIVADLEQQARTWLAEQGVATGEPRLTVSADLSYHGQAFELRVPLDVLTVDAVSAALHTEHERLYGFRDPQTPIRVGTARLTVVGPLVTALPRATSGGVAARPETAVPAATRPAFLGGQWVSARILHRAGLRAGDRFDGPAIVEQEDTTVVVPGGWTVTVDEFGNLRVRR